MAVKVGTRLEADCVNHTLGQGRAAKVSGTLCLHPCPKDAPRKNTEMVGCSSFPMQQLRRFSVCRGRFYRLTLLKLQDGNTNEPVR